MQRKKAMMEQQGNNWTISISRQNYRGHNWIGIHCIAMTRQKNVGCMQNV